MTDDQIARHLRRANDVALRAMQMGRHPFGALLVAPDGETVLAEQGNIDTVNHAESTLARHAAGTYPGVYLRDCTLVTTFEPCAMCAGTIYWAGGPHNTYFFIDFKEELVGILMVQTGPFGHKDMMRRFLTLAHQAIDD